MPHIKKLTLLKNFQKILQLIFWLQRMNRHRSGMQVIQIRIESFALSTTDQVPIQ